MAAPTNQLHEIAELDARIDDLLRQMDTATKDVDARLSVSPVRADRPVAQPTPSVRASAAPLDPALSPPTPLSSGGLDSMLAETSAEIEAALPGPIASDPLDVHSTPNGERADEQGHLPKSPLNDGPKLATSAMDQTPGSVPAQADVETSSPEGVDPAHAFSSMDEQSLLDAVGGDAAIDAVDLDAELAKLIGQDVEPTAMDGPAPMNAMPVGQEEGASEPQAEATSLTETPPLAGLSTSEEPIADESSEANVVDTVVETSDAESSSQATEAQLLAAITDDLSQAQVPEPSGSEASVPPVQPDASVSGDVGVTELTAMPRVDEHAAATEAATPAPAVTAPLVMPVAGAHGPDLDFVDASSLEREISDAAQAADPRAAKQAEAVSHIAAGPASPPVVGDSMPALPSPSRPSSIQELDDRLSAAAEPAVEAAIQAAAVQAAADKHAQPMHAVPNPFAKVAQVSGPAPASAPASGLASSAPAFEPAGVPVAHAASAAVSVPAPKGPGVLSHVKGMTRGVGKPVGAVIMRVAGPFARLTAKLGESTRQTLGYLAILTSFFALTVWAIYLLREPEKLPAGQAPKVLLRPGEHAAGHGGETDAHADPHSKSAGAAEAGHGDAASAGADAHGASKKAEHAEPAKKEAGGDHGGGGGGGHGDAKKPEKSPRVSGKTDRTSGRTDRSSGKKAPPAAAGGGH